LQYFGVVVVGAALLAGCSPNAPDMTSSKRYPAPWHDDANLEISRTLAWNQISGCGEFHYRPAYDNETHQGLSGNGEYLVYCFDGTTTATYVVFTVPNEDGRIVGPAELPPDIPAPKIAE
jgi:hypothetical protein